jgi:hypothetical protein
MKGAITPQTLISVDAPVQTRNYILPSSSSCKELPAAFAEKVAQVQLVTITRVKKRSLIRSLKCNVTTTRRKELAHSELDSTPTIENDDEPVVELGGVHLSSSDAASLQAAIAAKRIQNTHAARRSRARKLEYLKSLEGENKLLMGENEALRGRVGELEAMLVQRGGPT